MISILLNKGKKASDEFKPVYLSKPYSLWIPVNKELPEEGQEVLVTIETDDSYGKGTKIVYEVDLAKFHKETGYIKSANGNGFFNTDNDWDEGQPIQVIAWMSKPGAYSIKRSDDDAITR